MGWLLPGKGPRSLTGHAPSTAECEKLLELYERLEELDADKAEMRASRILHGLGFTPAMQRKKLKDFSGGWRMRVALARCVSPTSALRGTLSLLRVECCLPQNCLEQGSVVSLCQIPTVWMGGDDVHELKSELPDPSGPYWTWALCSGILGPALGKWEDGSVSFLSTALPPCFLGFSLSNSCCIKINY